MLHLWNDSNEHKRQNESQRFGSNPRSENRHCEVDTNRPPICSATERCPSRLKSYHCRTATLEKKLTCRCRDATAYKKILPRRCRDGFQKNVPNFTATTVLDQKYWY